MMQLITADLRNWWKDWELRLIVLFSASLQVMLVTLGSRRKSIYSRLLKATLWCTYLTADWASILALGVLSNRLANIKEKTGNLSPNDQLTAFWAPFLLVHLGGTDSITAYSLEDNELWLRYFATLFVKTGLTGYIYFLALTGSPLAVLAATMTVVGFIKFGERSLSLYLASKDRLRDSMLSPPESGPIYPKIMERYSMKKDEGYHVGIDEVIEIPVQENLFADNHRHRPEQRASVLLQASGLFQIFKLLFVDLILNVADLGNCKARFMDMSSQDAFDIIAVELSFMFDLLYTKAIFLYKIWSIAHRVITLSLTCAVLVFFSVQEWKKYLRVDICTTFSLLGVAILIECHSILRMIASDWTSIWLLKNQYTYKGNIIRFLQLSIYEGPRWSESVAQFSLLELSLRRKSWLSRAKLGKVEEKLQKHSSVKHEDFRNSMKDWIYKHLKIKAGDRDVCTISFDAGEILKKNNQHHMTWSTDDIEFDQSILIWHIATELCYFSDRQKMASKQGEPMTNYEMSKMVSRYLLYLLVMHPSMMPTGIGLLRYNDTSLEARKYFEEQRILRAQKDSVAQLARKQIDNLLKGNGKSEDEDDELFQGSLWLLEVETEIQPSVMRGGKSKSVLFDACRLASELKKIELDNTRWNLISKVWAEALMYSAYCCDGYEHAKRLSKGGELLSHVWLLMAHFGISKQVNTSQGHAVAKLVAG